MAPEESLYVVFAGRAGEKPGFWYEDSCEWGACNFMLLHKKCNLCGRNRLGDYTALWTASSEARSVAHWQASGFESGASTVLVLYRTGPKYLGAQQ